MQELKTFTRHSFTTLVMLSMTFAFGLTVLCFMLVSTQTPIRRSSILRTHIIIHYIISIYQIDYKLAIAHNEHLTGSVLYLHTFVLIYARPTFSHSPCSGSVSTCSFLAYIITTHLTTSCFFQVISYLAAILLIFSGLTVTTLPLQFMIP